MSVALSWPLPFAAANGAAFAIAGLREQLEAYERGVIASALDVCGGHQGQAALLLGVRRTTLNERIKRLRVHCETPPPAGARRIVLGGMAPAVHRWVSALAPGTTLEIRGVCGHVRVRGTDAADAEVVAVRTGSPGQGEAELSILEHAGGATLGVRHLRGARPGHCPPENRMRVEFRIQLPQGVALATRITTGHVEVLGVSGDVDVGTLRGEVILRAPERSAGPAN